MLLKQNKCLNFWGEGHNKKYENWEKPGGGPQFIPDFTNVPDYETQEELDRAIARSLEKQKDNKIHELLQALYLIANMSEIIELVGDRLSPLGVVALGNVAEQAASILKLLEKNK
jgi:hypothetical protein